MADYSIQIDTKDLDKLSMLLSTVGGSEIVAKAINKTAYDLHKDALNRAPHKTGALQSSLHIENASPTNLTAKVGTDIKYARAQEYGTVGMMINVPNGRRTRNGGQSRPYTFRGNIQPKYYMRDAKVNIIPEFQINMKAAAVAIVKYLTGY